MTKKKKHPRVCKICNKGIGKKESYVRLTHYKNGGELSTAFYHESCFRMKFMNFQKLQKQAEGILGTAGPLLQRFQTGDIGGTQKFKI